MLEAQGKVVAQGVEVDVDLAILGLVVVLIDGLIAGEVGQVLGAEVVNVVVGVGELVGQASRFAEGVPPHDGGVEVAVVHEVRLAVVARFLVEAGQHVATVVSLCVVGRAIDVSGHDVGQTDLRRVKVAESADADVQLVGFSEFTAQSEVA